MPLITPCYRGQFDPLSLTGLIRSLEAKVQGFVPCLSSGEGQMLNDKQWEQVVQATRGATAKPVLAGIKRSSLAATIALAHRAEELGCDGIVLPVPGRDTREVVDYFQAIAAETSLPIVIYNTETQSIQTLAALRQLEAIPSIIAIKDSSMNEAFFETLCMLRQEGDLRLSVLQGMEHQLKTPQGCDGYLIALANVEPTLCRQMFAQPSDAINQEILELFWRYNLGGDWFISLKSILFCRQTIRSAEQVTLAIQPVLGQRREVLV